MNNVNALLVLNNSMYDEGVVFSEVCYITVCMIKM